MHAFATLRTPVFPRIRHSSALASLPRNNATSLAFALIALLAFLTAMQGANAAGVTGAALKPAFDAVNDIVGGYGKQLLVLVGFVAASFAVLASNAASAMLKFIGYIIFLGVGLGIAVVVSGAVI